MMKATCGGTISAVVIAAVAVLLPQMLFRQKLEGLLSSPQGAYLPDDETGDVVVVLGYALTKEGLPTPTLWERVASGVRLFLQGRVGGMIFSGGHPGGGLRVRSEASVMQDAALSLAGLPDPPQGQWLLEEASRSTRENAVFSLRMAADQGWSKIVVATSTFHQLRSFLTFRCAARDPSLGGAILQVWMVRLEPHKIGQMAEELWSAGQERVIPGPSLLWKVVDEGTRIWDINREFLALALYWARGWLC
eukprot:jgi/Botrbrau1/14081/Bobra.182_3s0028.1